MKTSFFNVLDLETVLALSTGFAPVDSETVRLRDLGGRVLAETVTAEEDVPGFSRSTMDGYAVRGSSTFGASEANPAYLIVKGSIAMGEIPEMTVGPGEAVRIATGGMLPEDADSIVMIEYTELLDETTLEVCKSVAPGQHVIQRGEDVRSGDRLLLPGRRIRPQETGLLAALGREEACVYRIPRIGIISTGDEIVPVSRVPGPGQVRDINTATLFELCRQQGAEPVPYGLVKDDFDAILDACTKAAASCDAVLISGGSSVGTRDFTIDALERLPDSEIMVHGVSISPGKPTILSRSGHRMIWGLPGHATSAMVVFAALVRPFIDRIAGVDSRYTRSRSITAVLTRNVASAQGRTDFVRVRLSENNGSTMAEPIPGKSGLISTMVKADGLLRIDAESEGVDAGTVVEIEPF
ncbi:MAG: gephyrin-like molybdotransferase Glp [Desulfobacterales bacterium]